MKDNGRMEKKKDMVDKFLMMENTILVNGKMINFTDWVLFTMMMEP
jgi:hypothetical protein